jgi:translation elongation factor EF-Tu-like GTPase
MTAPASVLTVERVDAIASRPTRIFVSGRLEGGPLHVGDRVVVHDGGSDTSTEIRAIEMHSGRGLITIALDAELKSLIRTGTIISAEA